MAARFWVGGTGNWTDTTHWSTASGGSGGAAVPTSSDDVTFDANSGAGTCTMNANPGAALSLTTTNSSVAIVHSSSLQLGVSGDIALSSQYTCNNGSAALAAQASSGNHTIKFNGANVANLTVNATNGTYVLQDAPSTNMALTHTSGTFDTNSINFTIASILFQGTTGSNLKLNGSQITLTSGYSEVSTGGTITPGTSTITITGSTFNPKTIRNFNSLVFNGTVVTGTFPQIISNLTIQKTSTISAAYTITNLTLAAAATMTVSFKAGQTQTVTDTFTVTNTGFATTLGSTTPGSVCYLSAAAASVQSLIVQDIYSIGASTPIYDQNGTNGGNTAGWVFSIPSSVQKSYVYQVYRNGNYIGNLPNVTSDFAYSQDINTAGSQITITVGQSADTASQSVTPLLDEVAAALLDEASGTLYEERAHDVVGNADDTILIRNGNKIKVYEYSQYHLNGIQVFSGVINRWEANFGGDNAEETIDVLVYSTGLDLNNYIVTGSPYVADVSQTSQDSSLNNTLSITNKRGQTFVPSASNVAAIDLLFGSSSSDSGNVTVYLWNSASDASAGGTPLGSVTRTVTTLAGATIVTRFTFANPITVTAGQTYFFSVEIPGTGSPPWIHYQSTDVYANGSRYGYSSGRYYTGTADTQGDLYFVTYSNNGSTTAVFTSQDPSSGILKSVIDSYVAAGGGVNYSSTSVDATGLSLSYTFVTATAFEGVEACMRLAPYNYYWYVDVGSDTIYFKTNPTVASYTLVKGLHIASLKLAASIENIKNKLYFSGGLSGGSNLYTQYQDTTSINNFGQKLDRQSDNRVTIKATADAIGQASVNETKNEQYQTQVTILDKQMDITLFKLGQVIGFTGFGNFIDYLLLQIVRIDYSPDSVTLTLGTLPPRMNQTIAQSIANLVALNTVNNPSTPS